MNNLSNEQWTIDDQLEWSLYGSLIIICEINIYKTMLNNFAKLFS